MIKEGGMFSLWRGNGMSVAKIGPEHALKFYVYEEIKRLLKKSGDQLPLWEKLLYGSVAGVAAQSIVYPLDVLKTRLALRNTDGYKGVFHWVRRMYKIEGIKAFYRGYYVNLLGVPIAGGIVRSDAKNDCFNFLMAFTVLLGLRDV